MVRLTSADYYFTGILLYRNAHGFMVPKILLHSAICVECQYYPIKGVTTVSTPTPLTQTVNKPQCSDTFINWDMDGIVSAYYYSDCKSLPSNPSFNDRITRV